MNSKIQSGCLVLLLLSIHSIIQAHEHEKRNIADTIKPNRVAFISMADSINPKKYQQFKNIDEQFIYQYTKPTFWDIFKYIPEDIYSFGAFTVQKENLKYDAIVLGSTAALLPFDQSLTDNAGHMGHRIGGWDKDSQYGKVGGILTIVPKNISSGVYYMGNGGTTLLLSAVFYGIGKFSHDDFRAINTSNELIESLFSVGITTQALKRITGRQSPNRGIADRNDGGNWELFPSFNAFQKNTPNFDAMPSGHIATFMATLTIITTNYPEIRWIKPVGYSLMGVLAFNMVSSKVHWASDYPIGIFMGYVIGNTIADRRVVKITKNAMCRKSRNAFRYDYNFSKINNTNVIGAIITF